MKTTKGEWNFRDGQIYSLENGVTVAMIPYFDKEDEEQDANGKVMAVSKEMLEILKFIDDAAIRGISIEKGSSLHRDIMNVINKAEEG